MDKDDHVQEYLALLDRKNAEVTIYKDEPLTWINMFGATEIRRCVIWRELNGVKP